ncbi:hypothetical protein N7510_006863 [Penicillium lagena]|uniref:uncharacterized protein n=1 Tax=Penicillium lagena TaxID=94218 RepID=UPI002541F09C|nr:uncharacterized protein N7510_006863 [Penicillium lagena]KAJ5610144.1 hypothetical protein N7510_006863 [Penicillium lagena]
MQSLLRVHREVQEVNEDFHSLRTVLKDTDNKFKWDFVMFPNDGALAHLPLIGELIIPEAYPYKPPVFHLFTATFRSNVDIFRRRSIKSDSQSTMCFDILRSKTDGGTWDPDYTITCLFASLMQALVTPRVPQEYGADKPEFVSMGKLRDIKQSVQATYLTHKHKIPHLPAMPTIPATSIPAQPFSFTRLGMTAPSKLLEFKNDDTYISQEIYLQDPENPQAWSTVLDVKDLHPGVVFSVILSNKPGTDHTGRKSDTILLRNGVTGTAAKKLADRPIVWFYHGKPLNDQNLTVCITVTNDQFTISYKADGTDSFLVHGDTPISKLGRAQIGDVKGVPFYLNIFLKRKSGEEGLIRVLDQKQAGFIHANTTIGPQDWYTDPPVLVKLALEYEQTASLQRAIDFYNLGMDFQVQKYALMSAFQTLICSKDLPQGQYADVVNEIYAPLRDKVVELNVTAIIADGDCVALLTDTPQCSENGVEISCFPDDRVPHVMMRLRNVSIKAEYSDVLAKRVRDGYKTDQMKPGDTYVQLPQPIRVLCPLKFEFQI